MTRTTRAVVAVLVVLAVVASGIGAAAAVPVADGQGPSVQAAGAAQEDCSFPVTRSDATGTDVTLEEEPEDVVVTAPSAAQTIWELGERDRVVGMPVSESTAYLDGHDERTHVLDETGVNIDLEQVVDLDPDLVIAPGVTAEEDVEAMRDNGLTVYYEGEAGSIDAIRENTQTAGRLLGACEAAEETVGWMDEQLSTVEETVADADRPTVYYWLSEGFTAPEGSFQHDLLETAGAENAAAEMEMTGWQLADQEQIVDVDPEYLLLQEGQTVPDNDAIQATTAVQEDNVISVDGNDWNQNAPRVVLAVRNISEQLHPEAYEESEDESAGETESEDGTDDQSTNETETTEDESETDGADEGSETDGTETEDSDDGLPGFGVPAAVAALLAAVGIGLHRRT